MSASIVHASCEGWESRLNPEAPGESMARSYDGIGEVHGVCDGSYIVLLCP